MINKELLFQIIDKMLSDDNYKLTKEQLQVERVELAMKKDGVLEDGDE